MTNNLSGPDKPHRPPAPLPDLPPISPPFKPKIGLLANLVQSAATPILPANSTTTNVTAAKKPALPPRRTNLEVKLTLDLMQKTAKEGLKANRGIKGQKISEVRDNIKDNRLNVKWLTEKKKWAQDEIQKLNAAQKLLKLLEPDENYKEVNQLIHDTVQEYFTILHELEHKTPLERKISSTSSSSTTSLMSSVKKFGENLLSTNAQIITNEQVIRSLAGGRELSSEGFVFLERLTSGDLKDEFEAHLKALKTTAPPQTPLARSLQETDPKKFVDKWVYDLKTVRENQLSRLENGENALPSYDEDYASLLIRNQRIFNSFIHENLSMTESQALETFLRDATECAIPLNTQLLSDDFYPPGVREKAKLTSTHTRAEDVAKASQEKGFTEGFTQRTKSNMQNKSSWEKLKLNNGIFVKGYCKVAFRTSKGEQSLSGALFDLSPLHHLTGGLNEAEVVEVFRLTQEALSRHFNLLNEKSEDLQLRVANGEITDHDVKSINEMNMMLNNREKLGMNDQQLAVLRTTVIDFCNKLTNATNFALLNLGHEKG